VVDGDAAKSQPVGGAFLWWCDGMCGAAQAAEGAQAKESNQSAVDLPADAKQLVATIKSTGAAGKDATAVRGLLPVTNVAAAVEDRFALAGAPRKTTETLVVYDHLGARDGDLIAFAESREACMPFYPEKIVPLDAYNAAILDEVNVQNSVLSAEK